MIILGPSPRRARMRSRALLSIIALLVVVAVMLAGCMGEPGGQTLAFLRNGQLVIVNPDGSNARVVVGPGVLGFAWSPDHHQLVYRLASSESATTGAQPPDGLSSAPDMVSKVMVASINGGSGIEISPSSTVLARSDAWWSAGGTRLLYREEFAPGPGGSVTSAIYAVSQADQPVGIASKDVLGAATIPALSADGHLVAVIDPSGAVRVGAPGVEGRVIGTGALASIPGSDRPARVLWQPGHNAVAYLSARNGRIALNLQAIGSRRRALGTFDSLVDLAFSPSGSHVLVRTANEFRLIDVAHPSAVPVTWTESDPLALPFWSPNGQWILVVDTSGLHLLNARAGTSVPLLTYPSPLPSPALGASTVWHPATAQPWNSGGTQIVFVGSIGSSWRGGPLPEPHGGDAGVYRVSIGNNGPSGTPALIASGAIRYPSWGYADSATSFLMPS